MPSLSEFKKPILFQTSKFLVAVLDIVLCLYFRQPGALQLLTSLYAGRAHHLWRDVTILPWLERNVHAVLDLVDSQAAIIKEAEEKRGRRYQGTPKNIYRHVILSDIKDATTSLPRVNIKNKHISVFLVFEAK